MAKKKHKPEPADPKIRAQRAIAEGRFQQALELTKSVYKQQPTPEHLELLRQAYLGRARQLRVQGHTRDAATTLQAGLSAAGKDGPWVGKVAEELALSGDVRGALDLLPLCSEADAARIQARGVDAAVQQQAAGKKLLPEALHADFDRILQAFTQLQAGQDDPARETLQPIGLRSPFLEWKLFLRGLQAFYQQDDPRAVENWQRLNADRLPSRLAAPLRFLIDANYRHSQPHETQNRLQHQADRLQGSGLLENLRLIQKSLGADESLTRAFRLAESVVPQLRDRSPQFVSRLASCFFWGVVNNGLPEDVSRFERVFGAPPEDPHCNRLRALAAEHANATSEAHKCWQDFEKSVLAHPEVWPGEQTNRVRAMVWQHMGKNATMMEELDEVADEMPFPFRMPTRPKPLSPGPEACFKKSLELAPDMIEAHRELFHYYLGDERPKQAEQVGRRLLERFPDHVETLEEMGDLYMGQEEYGRALEMFQRALKANPLSRELRARVSDAHLFHARTFAEAGQFDEARREYQAAIAFDDSRQHGVQLCKWAACEYKAGDTEKAEELLNQALASTGNKLAVAYNLLIEVIRLKLPQSLKRRCDKEFAAALAETPTAAGVLAVLETARAHRLANVTYVGKQTHEKKVLAYVGKALKIDYRENELERLCVMLLDLDAKKLFDSFVQEGRRRFPKNPWFPYLQTEPFIRMGPGRCPEYRVSPLLQEAERLANALPRDERTEKLLEMIHQRQRLMVSLNPFAAMFSGGFNPFGGPDDDEDDEFWDDDEDF